MSFEEKFSILDKINQVVLDCECNYGLRELGRQQERKAKDHFLAYKKETLSSSGGSRRMFSLFSKTFQDSS